MKCNSAFIRRSLGSVLFLVVVLLYLPSLFTVKQAFAAKETSESNSFQLQIGNRLEVLVYREDDLSGVYEIDPSGKLTFPLIGEIQVAGLKIEKLREELTSRLKKYLVDPQVSISRAEDTTKSISVLGHVMKPGIYDYAPGSTLMRLISTAGGFAESASKKKIKIVRMVSGEKKVVVINSLDIINGTLDDPKLESGDIIFVPESIF